MNIKFILLLFVSILTLLLIAPHVQPIKNINTTYSVDNVLKKSIITIPAFSELNSTFLNHNHKQSTAHLSSLSESLGSGACVFDFNNDGWQDIFILGGSGHTRYFGKTAWWTAAQGNALFKNNGDGTFTNISKTSQIPQISWGMGCLAADFDHDGNQDLLITNYGKNILLRNNGNSTFSDMTELSGLNHNSWSTSATAIDINNDGLLDIYITNYINFGKDNKILEKNAGFATHNKTNFDVSLYDPQENHLYINMGGFKFKESAKSFGINNFNGRSLTSLWLDINNDNFPDLFVLNDTGSPNKIYLNNGQKFSASNSNLFNLQNADGGHCAVSGDIDQDGDQDILITRAQGKPTQLLINTSLDKQIRFIDEAWERGIAKTKFSAYTGWGCLMADFNNDGWLDIFIAHGHTQPDIDASAISIGQPNQLFINDKTGNFILVDKSHQSGINLFLSSRGMATIDYDNDGDLDVLVTNNNNQTQLLINHTNPGNNWIGVSFYNKNKNKLDEIVIKTNSVNISKKLSDSNSSFLTTSDSRYLFSLPDSSSIDISFLSKNKVINQIKNVIPGNYYRWENFKLNTVTTQNPSNKLQLKYSDNHLNTLYLKILFSSNELLNYPKQLSIISSTLSSSEKNQILDSIKRIEDTRLIPVIHQFLTDKSSKVKLKTIELLKRSELESSIYWLSQSVYDDDPRIVCSTADAFMHFFREEEAVMLRKNLIITDLLKSLEKAPPLAVPCLLNAIAESENSRGLSPLLSLLKNSDNIETQKAATYALGRIREKASLNDLITTARSNNANGETIAFVFSALRRLDYKNTKQLFNEIFDLNNKPISNNYLVQFTDFLNIALNDKEGIFIPQDLYEIKLKTINNALNNNNPDISLSISEKIIAEFLSVIYRHLNPKEDKLINELLVSSNPEVRILMIKTLIANQNIKTFELLKRGITDINNRVRKNVAKLILQYKINPSYEIINLIIERKLFVNAYIMRLANLTKKEQTAVFETLFEQPENQMSALLMCKKHKLIAPLDKVFPLINSRYFEESIACLLEQPTLVAEELSKNILDVLLSSSNEKFKDHAYSLAKLYTHSTISIFTKKLLKSSAFSKEKKQTLLYAISLENNTFKKNNLYKMLDSFQGAKLKNAIDIIDEKYLTAKFRDKLWNIAKNSDNTDEIQLTALSKLSQTNYDQVMQFLSNENKH